MTSNLRVEMKNIKNHHPQAHFIIINNGSLVYTLWK